MKVAYIILAHKLPDQLVRLVRKLDTESSFFLIHVDKKTDAASYRRMYEPLRGLPNVVFLPRRSVSMSDFSMLQAMLDGMREIQASGAAYDYVIRLSGQDYPIKSNAGIRARLEALQGQSTMQCFPLPDHRWEHEDGGLDRIRYRHFHWAGRTFVLRRRGRLLRYVDAVLGPSLSARLPLERELPGGLKPFGGSAFWCLSREAADYVMAIVRKNPATLKFFRQVQIPVEIFIQTVLLNSPLQDRIVDDRTHYVLWPSNPAVAHHPLILRSDNVEDLLASDKLFARKFDATVDSRVLDELDAATV